MADQDDLLDRLRDNVEGLLIGYISDKEAVVMPAIEDWVLVATFHDVADTDNGKWMYLRGRNQSVHRTVGLLTIASDDLRGICTEGD